MKRMIFALAMFSLGVLAVNSQTIGPGFGTSICFNEDWLFSLSDNPDYARTAFNDAQWRKLNLPHDWSIEGKLSPDNASCTGYLPAGIAWYRKHFKWQEDKKNPLTYIYFEAIYNRSEVYLNGKLVGKRPNGYVSFLYELTPYLQKGDNVIAVRVDHSRAADSRWYTGSGIYRDVYLVKAPKTHLEQWGVTYVFDGKDLKVNAILNNTKKESRYEAHVELMDKNHNLVVEKDMTVEKEMLHTALTLQNPNLWSVNNPYLYDLKVVLKDNGVEIDSTCFAIGLRTLKFDPDKGFFLNGQNMKVKGVCLHHDAGVLGAVVPEEVWRRRVRALKRMGANAIRMSHNIQAPVLYDICDQEGMLVLDEASDEWEFPKRKWIQGWNNGTPGYDGTFDFFEEWIDRDVADMVRRDRNHPSVFLWSVGNEVDYPNDPYSHPVLDGTTINQPMFGGYKPDAPNAERIGLIAKRLAQVIRKEDESRPVTGALAGVVMSNQTIYPEVIDVVGYNYTENRYREDHKTYPDRIIYGSETGVGYEAWKAVRDNEFIFGQFVWTGTDYLGESGRWPSRGLNTGLLNFGNFKKPRGWFRQSIWAEDPMAYIGTYPLRNRNNDNNNQQRRQRRNMFFTEAPDYWNYREGTNVRVVCYTNQPQARLMLNNQVVGEMKAYNDTIGMIYWDVPYQPGTLLVQAFDEKGEQTASYLVATSKQPTKLVVEDLTQEGLPEGEEPQNATILQLLVKIVDDDGNVVKMANDDITCVIEGKAELLGLEASNNSDMSDYTDNHQNAFQGTLLAYIRKQNTQPVTITFSTPNLPAITIQR